MRILLPSFLVLVLIGCTQPAAPPEPSANEVVLKVPGMT